MELFWILLFSVFLRYVQTQGVYAPANAQIVHSGQTCVVKEDNISERIYTIREGDTLVLQCLVKGHPRPQVRWTKTAGSASDKFQETSIFNETLRIPNIQRVQGGRYYCKAENGVGVAAIKSIRVDVQYLDKPVLTVHQTVGDVRGNYYQEKTVFLRCTVNSNPPARFIWKRGNKPIEQSKDNGVDIYEPLYTQGETKVLKLKNLRPQDFANYTCQVSVRNVCDIPDSSVTFRLTNTTTPPALKLSVNETYVVDPGQDVTLSCEVTAGFPTPTVSWSRYPGSLPQRSMIRGGSLTLRSVTPTDAGVYNCTAVNNVGNPARRTVNLIVRSKCTRFYTYFLKRSDIQKQYILLLRLFSSFPVIPPVLSVPVGGGVVNVSEGGTSELVCLVDGKPRPPVLWSRANKDLPMPSGDWVVETRDGRLRLTNVTRDMMGAYRCQTAPYNGLNIKRRQAQVQLNVEYPPVVDPVLLDVRSQTFSTVNLRCLILKSNPNRIAGARWYRNGLPIRTPTVDPQSVPQLRFKLDTTNNGTYECRVSNGVGTSTCTFIVSAQPYNAEFYYDTPNPIRTLKNNYSYILQWTQKEPGAVDKIIGYWINVQQVKQTPTDTGKPVKGVLMSYTLTDLRIPLSYEVSLTPITSFGTGNTVTRSIQYSERKSPSNHVCGFEDIRICGFTQDRSDVFDWTRQNHLTQNPKRSVNTGPDTDRSGTKEGYYMYIETSRPRQAGDRARLLSPLYNVTAARGPTGTTRTPYCVSFYYNMNGKHIGTLNVLMRVKSIATVDSAIWTLSGHQGPEWRKADAEIYPSGPFQVVFEGIRGNGFEGDIAIDDVSVTKGKCKQKDSVDKTGLYHQ
uniref:MAM domain containing glycosylphosphatidylinositol anchor 1 n=1 Tax=Cyprinus carpio TaxID=7962 RepID=A0A8C1MXM5_CYPCA